jgi:thiol reductant ABC exporter CydC subunit
LATHRVRAGELAGVLLAVVVLTPLAVFEAVAPLPVAAQQLGAARSALRRVFALLDQPDPIPAPTAPQQPRAPSRAYHLRLEDVSARWPSADRLAVKGVSLDLPPGRRVAVIGPSGCGKTTVAALLVRFLDPVRGRVTLDGVDLRALDGDDVRTVVGLVDADAHIFDTSIEANLRIGDPDADVQRLRAALRDAKLLSWVDSLPAGLATPLGERGATMSGGQRRRLALARALLRDPPILVLDEPTEHLDEPTAQEITDDLLAMNRERTVVLITHRPYGLDQVDEIIELHHPST